VLYELLTGERAFDGGSIPAILTRVAYDDPPPPSHKNPTLPPELDLILARALAKHPGDRYQSGQELADDLEDVLARRPPRHVALRHPPRRGRRTLITTGDQLDGLREQFQLDPRDTQRSAIGLALPVGKRVSLAIIEGPSQGAVHPVERPRVVIGRSGGDSGAQLEIPDPEISRAHAVVEFYGDRVLLRDLDSTNGTFVGNQRVRDHELQHQSEFRIGKTRFMLVLTEPDAD
jgi:serine/threonine protein kinase